MGRRTAILSTLFAVVSSQQVGTYQTETHPSLTWQTCTAAGSCTTTSGSVVIDANWRWIHGVNSYTNCYTGNTWDSTLCPNDTAGAANCALEGAVYDSTYGVTTSGNALTLKYVQNNSNGKNIGSRLYLLSSDTAYQGFNLLAKEFTFDVDVSQLGCGLNGALYFVNMDLDGGTSRFPTNKAGAKYGTGYCDSQCPRDLKFISGQANCDGWTPSSSDVNTGVGGHGSCCDELDVWEANSISSAFTPHPCKTATQTLCSGDACGGTYSATRYAGTCDPDGCDFNSYRMGNTSYYGPGLIVDTTKPFTVVTQFLTNTGTSSGTLNEIRRFYVQNGKLIPNSYSKVSGVTGNSLTASFCDAQKTAFGDNNTFDANGGFSGMSAGLAKGMVLVMSLWSDDYADMLWLDSTYPTTKSASTPGVARGTCSTTSGDPNTLENTVPNSQVIYSNIKFGPINSTYTYTSTAHVV